MDGLALMLSLLAVSCLPINWHICPFVDSFIAAPVACTIYRKKDNTTISSTYMLLERTSGIVIGWSKQLLSSISFQCIEEPSSRMSTRTNCRCVQLRTRELRNNLCKEKIGARRNHNLIMHQFLATRPTKCIHAMRLNMAITAAAAREKKRIMNGAVECTIAHAVSHMDYGWSDRKCLDFGISSLASPRLYVYIYIYYRLCALCIQMTNKYRSYTLTHSHSIERALIEFNLRLLFFSLWIERIYDHIISMTISIKLNKRFVRLLYRSTVATTAAVHFTHMPEMATRKIESNL